MRLSRRPTSSLACSYSGLSSMSPGWNASLSRSPASARRFSATSRSRLSFSSPSGVSKTGSVRSISQPFEMITRRMDPTDLRAELAERLAGSEPIDAQTFNAACFMLSRALEELDLSVPEAAPLIRRLLRVAGRVVIDTGLPDSVSTTWPNTEEMALLWIDEALRELGYHVRPSPKGGRAEISRVEESKPGPS